jgi:hypothetical protein
MADPVSSIPPDPPPSTAPSPAPVLRPSWDLDGTYLWLGPTGAASWAGAHGMTDAGWDSTFGADATIVRVREHELLGAIGGSLGASRWTVRGGGRIWVDALAGTPLLGHMIGASAGPLVELSDTAHPRFGGSIGVWGFLGVTPFARVGVVDSLGTFAEIGVHIALPVIRR